jgi:hypothetical protein
MPYDVTPDGIAWHDGHSASMPTPKTGHRHGRTGPGKACQACAREASSILAADDLVRGEAMTAHEAVLYDMDAPDTGPSPETVLAAMVMRDARRVLARSGGDLMDVLAHVMRARAADDEPIHTDPARAYDTGTPDAMRDALRQAMRTSADVRRMIDRMTSCDIERGRSHGEWAHNHVYGPVIDRAIEAVETAYAETRRECLPSARPDVPDGEAEGDGLRLPMPRGTIAGPVRHVMPDGTVRVYSLRQTMAREDGELVLTLHQDLLPSDTDLDHGPRTTIRADKVAREADRLAALLEGPGPVVRPSRRRKNPGGRLGTSAVVSGGGRWR